MVESWCCGVKEKERRCGRGGIYSPGDACVLAGWRGRVLVIFFLPLLLVAIVVLCLKGTHDTITKSSRTEQKLFHRTGGRFSGDEGEEEERAAAAAQQEDCCSILVLGWIDG